MLNRGEHVGRYEVETQIAVGGMATTYLARLVGEGGFEKLVVLKVMRHEHAADRAFVDMFLDEARLSARMAHPNIPQVFELGSHAGVPYIVMEHVDGPSLHRLLRQVAKSERRPPAPWATTLFKDVALALDYASHGIDPVGKRLTAIHRDVSPSNILVAPGGRAKLIDFGIAKAEARLHETEVGTLKGRMQFVSPEQLAGLDDIDCRADIYALGVCMFEAISGTSPHVGRDAVELFRNRLQSTPRSLLSVAPECPPDLAAVVERAMSVKPEDRYERGSHLARALDDLMEANPSVYWRPERVADYVHALFPEGSAGWLRKGAESATGSGASPSNASLPPTLMDSAEPEPTHTAHTREQLYANLAKGSTQGGNTMVGMVGALSATVVILLVLLAGAVVYSLRNEGAAPALRQAAMGASLTLTSDPPGAEVWEGNSLLGNAPLTVELDIERGGEPRTFEFRLDGHVPRVLVQRWSPVDVVQGVALQPAAAPVTPTPAPAPARPNPAPAPAPAAPPEGPADPPLIDPWKE